MFAVNWTALQTVQVVLGEDNPEWGSSNAMPAPTGELSRYRGALSKETARFIKTSRLAINPEILKGYMTLCSSASLGTVDTIVSAKRE